MALLDNLRIFAVQKQRIFLRQSIFMKFNLLKSVVVTMAIGFSTSIIAQTNAYTIDTIVSKTDSVPSVIDIPKIASNGVKMSLEDCIAIALSENPTIKVADMEIERLDYS
ncbi:MAG: hypothetical protein IK120_07900, partial [Muribaculaceae bacterium]|nr:hypothetical protein [Muribaculaceae bacterium]